MEWGGLLSSCYLWCLDSKEHWSTSLYHHGYYWGPSCCHSWKCSWTYLRLWAHKWQLKTLNLVFGDVYFNPTICFFVVSRSLYMIRAYHQQERPCLGLEQGKGNPWSTCPTNSKGLAHLLSQIQWHSHRIWPWYMKPKCMKTTSKIYPLKAFKKNKIIPKVKENGLENMGNYDQKNNVP